MASVLSTGLFTGLLIAGIAAWAVWALRRIRRRKGCGCGSCSAGCPYRKNCK